MLDGGPGAEPTVGLDAWLVCDLQGELQPAIRRIAALRGLLPVVSRFERPGFVAEPREVRHTSHPTYGYRITSRGHVVVWAPEFLDFPDWAAGADLMFAEAAAWSGPIRFARGAGGHAPLLEVGRLARAAGVKRLVYAHVGRRSIRALDRGLRPPFGELGVEGATYTVDGGGAPGDRGSAPW